MPPREEKKEEITIDIIGKSDDKICDIIGTWFFDIMKKTGFYQYPYDIIVGDQLILFVTHVLHNSVYIASRMLKNKHIRHRFGELPESDYKITIRWSEPVTGLDGVFLIDTNTQFDAWKNSTRVPQIKKVIYNNPATIIYWADDTKTVVQCQKGDDYDPEKGLAMAIAKKSLGNTSRKLNDVLHRHVCHGCTNCRYRSRTVGSFACWNCIGTKGHPNWEPKE